MSSHQSGAQRSTVMAAASLIDESARFPSDGQTETFSLFFYGTLVHPAILARMIGHDGTTLTVQPAVLPGYALHHVKGEDYPALVPLQESQRIRGHGQTAAAATAAAATQSTVAAQPILSAVRGSLVRGLNEMDVRKLDLFEGDEYIRTAVKVVPDANVPPVCAERVPRDQSIGQTLASLTPERIEELVQGQQSSSVSCCAWQACHVYLWHASTDMLEPHIWMFETFMSSGNHTKWWQG